MNSLVYLVLTGAKNGLKELLRKPVKLVMYLLVVALIGGLIVLTAFTGGSGGEANLPLFWVQGIYFAFLVMFFIIGIQKGLTSGDTIFEMSDVNLLFVSPVNPRAILLYGLVRLAKMSFLAGFFILFQSSSLANFGVDFGGLLIIFFTFILSLVVQSILSLVIYSATNGRPRRKAVVKALAALIFVPLVVYFATQYLSSGDFLAALQQAVTSPLLTGIPIIGWTAAAAMALIGGNLAAGLAWLGLLVLAAAGMLAYIMLSRADYYEDVLVATETAFERKRAAAEGDIQAAAAAGTGRVKVTKTGLRGAGAPVLFYKHLRETFRQNRLGFFGLSTVIIFASVMVAAVFMGDVFDVVIILQVLMWMQIFLIGNGRGLRELYTHYIYLIPEPPFKKVVWSNMELVFKTLIESLLFLGVPGLIMGGSVFVILASILAYTLFSLLLLGVNYLSMRFGANLSTGLLLTVYFIAVMLLMAPGLVPALIVGFTLGGAGGTILALLILSAWELIAALACFALAKNVLHNCDMPSAKPTGK